jgi:hypothetical protein
MFKNMDYRDTYSTPEFANVRYPSFATQAIGGWAYVFSQDKEYIYGLSQHHVVEVRSGDRWIPYNGSLPNQDEMSGHEPLVYSEHEDSDPNY